MDMRNKLLLVIFFYGIALSCFGQNDLKERRIYLLDATKSMAGQGVVKTPNIFSNVKQNLIDAIDEIDDPQTEIFIIPFTDKTHETIIGRISQKDSLKNVISKISLRNGDTNIIDAWSKGVSLLDSTKVNYMFLLTDGLHNYGQPIDSLHKQLKDWKEIQKGKYYFAFYVMLTENAVEQNIRNISNEIPQMWSIQTMNIKSALIRTSLVQSSNIYENNRVSVKFYSNNNRVFVKDLDVKFSIQNNPYYEVSQTIQDSNNPNIFHFDIVEKMEKSKIPVDENVTLHINYNHKKYPLVFFTPEDIEFHVINRGVCRMTIKDEEWTASKNLRQGWRNLTHNKNKVADVDFGKKEFEEPFRGFLSSKPSWLVNTLDFPILKQLKSDTIEISKVVQIEFNEDAVRSNASVTLNYVDEYNNKIKDNNVQILYEGKNICNEGVIVQANQASQKILLTCKLNPEIGEATLRGYFIVSGNGIDEANGIKLNLGNYESVATWEVTQKIGWPILTWLIWLIMLCVILALISWLLCILVDLVVYVASSLSLVSSSAGTASVACSSFSTNVSKGQWRKGNTEFVLNLDYIPKNKNYSNIENKTVRQLGKDLGDNAPSIKFEGNDPVFDKDPQAPNGKPYQVEFKNGIQEHLNKDEIIKRNGKNINRQNLHNRCYEKLSKQTGKSIDEIKVFKGDSEPIQRLANKWGCSEKEVWKRCGNPNKVQRVWHECKDTRTVQLVPRLYHDIVNHKGGIYVVCKNILSSL